MGSKREWNEVNPIKISSTSGKLLEERSLDYTCGIITEPPPPTHPRRRIRTFQDLMSSRGASPDDQHHQSICAGERLALVRHTGSSRFTSLWSALPSAAKPGGRCQVTSRAPGTAAHHPPTFALHRGNIPHTSTHCRCKFISHYWHILFLK